jgi:hypothetical protein
LKNSANGHAVDAVNHYNDEVGFWGGSCDAKRPKPRIVAPVGPRRVPADARKRPEPPPPVTQPVEPPPLAPEPADEEKTDPNRAEDVVDAPSPEPAPADPVPSEKEAPPKSKKERSLDSVLDD